MRVAVVGGEARTDVAALADDLSRGLRERGHELVGDDVADAGLVLNLTSVDQPRAHWRRDNIRQFGVSLLAGPAGVLDEFGTGVDAPAVLRVAYPALVQTMSNAVVLVDGRRQALVTPEMGVRPLAPGAGSVTEAVLPLAGARFAIENRVREDLPEHLHAGNAATDALVAGGARLAALGLLPSPVDLDELLEPADRRLLQAIFGVQQLSYGNVSVREPEGGFWMSGRGVDKAHLRKVGRDVLRVTAWDRAAGSLDVSVPPGGADARVSVDALEHALLYEAYPEIGAILHVHAWIDGVDATRQNWPCGTVELADDVLTLVARQPDPCRAEIGLRNHGLTLTGPTLEAIFARVEGRLIKNVPAS